MSQPRVKICGITNQQDAIAAASAGAEYLGYILNYKKSPRYINIEAAADIITGVRQINPDVKHVGVFVDPTIKEVKQFQRVLHLDIIQLHGDESQEFISQLHLPTWKAIEVKDESDIDSANGYAVSGIVFDSGKGSGKKLSDKLTKQLTVKKKITFVLSGGLSPKNIASQLELTSPDIIDISSGVESKPGKKDPKKIAELFKTLNAL